MAKSPSISFFQNTTRHTNVDDDEKRKKREHSIVAEAQEIMVVVVQDLKFSFVYVC